MIMTETIRRQLEREREAAEIIAEQIVKEADRLHITPAILLDKITCQLTVTEHEEG